MARDYVDIGPTLCEEKCQQVGTKDYDPVMAKRECRAFLNQLRRILGPEPEGARLAVKSHPHDFGNYEDVVCYFDDNLKEAIEYAYKAEASDPGNWDDEAKKELGL